MQSTRGFARYGHRSNSMKNRISALLSSDGIIKGELPLDPRVVAYGKYHAADLTTNNNRAAQRVWADGTLFDKTTRRSRS